MKFIDLHCDTVSEIYYEKRDGKPYSLRKNGHHIDLKRLAAGNCYIQCFAAFTNYGREKKPYEYVNKLIDLYYDELSLNNDIIAPVLCLADIGKNEASGKMSAMLTVEEGEACEGDPEKLRALYNRGVRLMNITWNFENSLGYPSRVDMKTGVFEAETERGLKPAGFEIIKEMQKLGMIIDVSHLSDKGFYDVASAVSGPFVASHSNSRSVCNHPRNLTDDMIRVLAEHGGIAGINYCSDFVKLYTPGVLIDDLVPHFKNYIKVGGEDCVCLGSDFDGIDSFGLEVPDPSHIDKLYDGLIRSGITAGQADKILYKNAERVITDILK